MTVNFKPQKVLSLDKALSLKKPKIHGDYILTEKIDGWDTNIIYDEWSGKWLPPMSSRMRVIPAFAWMIEKLDKLPKPHATCVLKAEAYLPDVDFHTMNGIFNRTVGNFSCRDVHFALHDIVYPNQATSAATRLRCLQDLDTSSWNNWKKIEVLHEGAFDARVWYNIFDKTVEEGGEGIVAKQVTSFYQQGARNASLLKLKLECTVDLLAVRLEESIGEKGFPSLTLVSVNKRGTEVRTVISRLIDIEKFSTDPNSIIGKVVEIKGMEILEDGQIRQPVFKCIRSDKTREEIDL